MKAMSILSLKRRPPWRNGLTPPVLCVGEEQRGSVQQEIEIYQAQFFTSASTARSNSS
ncbi:MAG: hypothetical protein ACSLEN_00875 [Candidatus Malihini olakiniferum]